LLMFLCALLSIRFFTLLEEKILCLFHICKGPCYVGLGGVLQPFSYALGLLSRSIVMSKKLNIFVFVARPALSLLLRVAIWVCTPFLSLRIIFNKSFFFFLVVLGLRVFPILLTGWSSNNKYANIGSLRGVAQSVSYELCLRFFLLSMVFFLKRVRLKYFIINLRRLGAIIMFPLLILVFVLLLAESNRRPFDFSERPSELVRGFITEYSGVGFVMLFIREYLTIMFIRILFFFFFFFFFSFFYVGLIIRFICFTYIWVRGTVIRLRYDILISLNWKHFLPVFIYLYMYVVGVRVYYI